MENQLIVETEADDPWADHSQRPMEANTPHEQSRAEIAGCQTPVFCISDFSHLSEIKGRIAKCKNQ